MNEWIKKMDIHTYKHYLAIKRKDILTGDAITFMHLKDM